MQVDQMVMCPVRRHGGIDDFDLHLGKKTFQLTLEVRIDCLLVGDFNWRKRWSGGEAVGCGSTHQEDTVTVRRPVRQNVSCTSESLPIMDTSSGGPAGTQCVVAVRVVDVPRLISDGERSRVASEYPQVQRGRQL